MRVTPRLCNLQHNEILRSKLQKKLNNNLLLFATLRSHLQRVTCPLQPAFQRTVVIMAQVGEMIAF